MSDIAIRVENLGKKYLIRHQRQGKRYKALRDVIAEKISAPFRKLAAGNGSDVSGESDSEVFWAIDDVSFNVNQGEVVGIIGRNGAGKSTLLKVLSRITEPTKGRVELNGRVASLLEVGTGFHPELTGRENIYLNGAILGMARTEIRSKFDEIVAFAEVEKFLDTPVKRYSSGMYVRLAFSVAAHLDPEILIVDEVLAVGDTQFQKKCIGKMQDVSRSGGRTVLFVSHNLQTVKQMCEKVILLEKGVKVFEGMPHLGFARYLGQDSQSTETTIDLAGIPRGSSPKSAQFVSLKFHDKQGNPVANAERNTELVVTIGFRVMTAVTSLDIAMAVVHVEGQRVFSESYVDQFPRLALAAGDYQVSFLLPLHFLKIESYFLAIAMSDAGQSCDLIEGIPMPQILDSSSDPYLESHRWGVVRIPVRWDEVTRQNS